MALENFALSLGPLLFNWPPEQFRDFYFRIADEADIDTVYLGETVCTKRRAFNAPFYPKIIERLQAADKQIILSSLQLVMDTKDMASLTDTTALADEFLVEANDLSACSQLAGKPHALGPSINIYNETTLRYFEKEGATRVSLNAELPSDTLKILTSSASCALEVQVFGRLPLAISARCFHARAHRLAKNGCQYICDRDPDGLTVNTLDDQPFLAINGLQTLSYTYVNLLAEIPDLMEMGIRNFRLSPHTADMVKTANLYRARAAGRISGREATERLQKMVPNADFSNGFFHGQAGFETIPAFT